MKKILSLALLVHFCFSVYAQTDIEIRSYDKYIQPLFSTYKKDKSGKYGVWKKEEQKWLIAPVYDSIKRIEPVQIWSAIAYRNGLFDIYRYKETYELMFDSLRSVKSFNTCNFRDWIEIKDAHQKIGFYSPPKYSSDEPILIPCQFDSVSGYPDNCFLIVNIERGFNLYDLSKDRILSNFKDVTSIELIDKSNKLYIVKDTSGRSGLAKIVIPSDWRDRPKVAHTSISYDSIFYKYNRYYAFDFKKQKALIIFPEEETEEKFSDHAYATTIKKVMEDFQQREKEDAQAQRYKEKKAYEDYIKTTFFVENNKIGIMHHTKVALYPVADYAYISIEYGYVYIKPVEGDSIYMESGDFHKTYYKKAKLDSTVFNRSLLLHGQKQDKFSVVAYFKYKITGDEYEDFSLHIDELVNKDSIPYSSYRCALCGGGGRFRDGFILKSETSAEERLVKTGTSKVKIKHSEYYDQNGYLVTPYTYKEYDLYETKKVTTTRDYSVAVYKNCPFADQAKLAAAIKANSYPRIDHYYYLKWDPENKEYVSIAR